VVGKSAAAAAIAARRAGMGAAQNGAAAASGATPASGGAAPADSSAQAWVRASLQVLFSLTPVPRAASQ